MRFSSFWVLQRVWELAEAANSPYLWNLVSCYPASVDSAQWLGQVVTSHPEAALTAVALLAAIGVDCPELVRVPLARGFLSPFPRVRISVVRAIHWLQDPEANVILEQQLAVESHPDVRQEIQRSLALQRIGG